MNECVVVAEGENKGLVKHANFTKSSKVVDMMGRIHSDISFHEKLLINGIGVRIRFIRSKNSFLLDSTDAAPTHKVKIVRAVLRARKYASPNLSTWRMQKLRNLQIRRILFDAWSVRNFQFIQEITMPSRKTCLWDKCQIE